MHIAIAGNIGAGKTTLTATLAEHYGWDTHYEDVDDNPYLNDFYTDMTRWSFNLQIYFLNSRFRQVLGIRQSGKNVIQDRSIYEDAYIFAPNLYEMDLMPERDFTNYRSLFELMSSLISPPDLMIYLKASVPTLVRQIQKRGRDYEAQISHEYLAKLNDKYDKWIENYTLGKLLVIEVDKLDFIENQEDLNSIVARVDAASATVGLIELPDTHAFAHLKPTDNIIQFTTARYHNNPLIVQGPGAGREVTAAGVFAEIDEVPACGRPAEHGIVLAQVVGPAGDAGEGRIRLAPQQDLDLAARLRCHVVPCQQRHQPMAQRAPCVCRKRQQRKRDGQEECGNEKKGTDHAGTLTDTGRPHCALRALCVAQNFTT